MKRLINFIHESLILEGDEKKSKVSDETKKEILKKLSEQSELSGYVDVLNSILADNDASGVLAEFFVDSKDEDALDFSYKMQSIPVSALHPTQNEIDVDKSIGYPFKGMSEAKENMEKFYSGDTVKMPFPLITYNGEFIIDGHHRWSQVWTFNPKAEMECLDITVKKGGKVTPQQMLKIVQGVIAAKRENDKKGNIPQSKVEGKNLFKFDKKEVKHYIVDNYFANNEEIGDYIKKAVVEGNNEKSSTNEGKEGMWEKYQEAAGILTNHLMSLKDHNIKYADEGNPRGVMPQTDKGGNDPDKMKSAEVGVDGSALNLLVNGKINHEVLPK